MKNKSLIMSIALASAGLLGFVFLALPYLPEVSGYTFIELFGDIFNAGMPFTHTLFYLTPFVVLICSILLLGFGIVNILGATKVIKSEKFLKISKLITLIVASVFAAFILFAFILGLIDMRTVAAGLVLLLITALAALAASILDKVLQEK